MSYQVHFILNNQEITDTVPPGLLVLDYLRQKHRLIGTKEGCKEGDCGACVVLVGELVGERVRYKPVTSCLMPVGELQGKHLVTIEGLNGEGLTPVQQAIVEEGGSQCGFCTPGIVVSLTGYLLEKGTEVDHEGIKYALGGHLCRCTGYASLKRAGSILIENFGNGSRMKGRLTGEKRLEELIKHRVIPEYFRTIPARLKKLAVETSGNGAQKPKYFIAGGTDLYVQKGPEIPEAPVKVLNLYREWKGIEIRDGKFHVGALTTFEEFGDHREIQKIILGIKDYMHLIASWQIRNRATLGGNIVNASPIGDMTMIFLALEADLVLQEGQKRRVVPITSFYKGYKILEKKPGEILTEIVFPVPASGTRIHFEKVSKRKCLDIASVNSAIRVRCEDGFIADIGLAMGGVAPVPLFMKKTCNYLRGKPLSVETISEAFAVAMDEISPISDVRGSAEYKRLLVRQLLMAHFIKLYPEYINVRDFYETL